MHLKAKETTGLISPPKKNLEGRDRQGPRWPIGAGVHKTTTCLWEGFAQDLIRIGRGFATLSEDSRPKHMLLFGFLKDFDWQLSLLKVLQGQPATLLCFRNFYQALLARSLLRLLATSLAWSLLGSFACLVARSLTW